MFEICFVVGHAEHPAQDVAPGPAALCRPLPPFAVVNLKPEHPVMKGFPAKWLDDPDELYEIKKVWPDCTPLAEALTPIKETDKHPCIWVNTYGKARVFGTTLGHGNETMQREVYLDLVTRGLLWACDKLDEDGKPKAGYGKKSSAKAE